MKTVAEALFGAGALLIIAVFTQSIANNFQGMKPAEFYPSIGMNVINCVTCLLGSCAASLLAKK